MGEYSKRESERKVLEPLRRSYSSPRAHQRSRSKKKELRKLQNNGETNSEETGKVASKQTVNKAPEREARDVVPSTPRPSGLEVLNIAQGIEI